MLADVCVWREAYARREEACFPHATPASYHHIGA